MAGGQCYSAPNDVRHVETEQLGRGDRCQQVRQCDAISARRRTFSKCDWNRSTSLPKWEHGPGSSRPCPARSRPSSAEEGTKRGIGEASIATLLFCGKFAFFFSAGVGTLRRLALGEIFTSNDILYKLTCPVMEVMLVTVHVPSMCFDLRNTQSSKRSFQPNLCSLLNPSYFAAFAMGWSCAYRPF